MGTMTLFDVNVNRSINKRVYQDQFDSEFDKAISDGHRNVLAVLPTGAGKTSAAGEVVAKVIEGTSPVYRVGRVLWLAHRNRLVKQARDDLHRNYGMDGGVEMADLKADGCPLVFSSIQTMGNRVKQGFFPSDYFDLIVIDEGHRALAPTYQAVFDHFDAPVLGITATPRRGDQRDLMDFYNTKSIDIPLNQLINEGYLCPLKIENFPLQIDVSQVKMKGGDYDAGELGHVIGPYLGAAAEALSSPSYSGRKMLVYLPLINLSVRFAELAKEQGLEFIHVDGTTPDERVAEALAMLEAGEVDGICNSMLLTEGVDIPCADLLLNLRPTKSWVLYVQINGRLTRNHPGKRNALILDPLWLCDDHSMLKRPACLVARDEEEEESISGELEGGGGDLMEAQAAVAHEREDTLRRKLEENRQRKSRQVDAMEFFLSIGEIDLAEYEPIAKWERLGITPGQLAVLEKKGFDLEEVQGRGHASAIISALVERGKRGLATPKMAKFAAALGMDSPWEKPFEEVSGYISSNAKNRH